MAISPHSGRVRNQQAAFGREAPGNRECSASMAGKVDKLSKELTQVVAGKRIAWLLAILAAMAMLATVAQSSRHAHATAPGTVSVTAPVQATSLVEKWTFNFTSTAATNLTSVTLTFPAGFVVPGTPTVTVNACTIASKSTAGQVVTINITGACDTSAASTATVAGVTNTATAGTTGNFSIATSLDTTATTATAGIWNTTAAAAPTSITADGASTSAVTFTASTTAANTTTTASYVVQTSGGTILSVTGTGNFSTQTGVNATSSTGVIGGAVTAADTITVVLQAPSAAGSASVTLKVVPQGGGNAVLEGATAVTFTAAPPTPGPAASVAVTTSATSIVAAGGTATITATVLDANGNQVFNGTAVTFTTGLGTLTGGTQVAVTSTTAGVATTTLTGANNPGVATVTATAGSVSGSVTVQLTGAVASVTESSISCTTYGARSNPPVGNTVDCMLVRTLDAAGQGVNGSTVTFAVTPADGKVSVTSGTTALDATLGANGYYKPVITVATTAVAGTSYTITASSGGFSASAAVVIGAAFSGSTGSITISAPDLAVNTTGTITATLKDATGNLVGDGYAVTFTVSNGVIVGAGLTSSPTTAAGVAKITYASPSTPGQVNLVVSASTAVKTATFNITGGTATPTQVVVTATTTGIFCFAYSGPTKAVADFGTTFTSGVTAVNILQLPAGNWNSWFAAAPTLATATSLSNGQNVCVQAPVGSNVFN